MTANVDAYADLTSNDTFVAGVPHATFARLRDTDPVSFVPERDGSGFWAVTRWADVRRVSADSATFTTTKGIRMEEWDAEQTLNRRTMMNFDPPEHTRLRRLVNRGFTRRVVQSYENGIRLLTRAVLDEALVHSEIDFVEDVAKKLPMRMLGQLLGVPDEDGPQLVQWGDALIGNADPEFTEFPIDLTDTEAFRLLPFRSPATLHLFRYAEEAAAQRRAHPTDDVITKLLAPTLDGEPLSDLEFKNFFTLLVAAGNDTTRYSLAHGMAALMANPDQLARWREDFSISDTAADEILRSGSVTMHFRRTAQVDTEVGGRKIKAGDKVVMWYISANHDERQFAEPYRLDLCRDPNEHVAFGGGGPHFCLGAWLARMEIKVVFEELLPRLADIRPNGPVERLRSNFISGIKHLPVRLTLA